MTAGQARAWEELWPIYGVEFTGEPLNLDALFGRHAPRVLEIGFGTGDALLEYAKLHPEHDCLGIEVHPPGVGHLMIEAHKGGLANIRAICHDAVEVLEHALTEQSLDEAHIFFPDPWHKKRHHKRRLIQQPFVGLLTRVLKQGGVVKLATDWQHYAEQMLDVMRSQPDFENVASGESPYSERAVHRPLTRFERRGHRLGHGVWDLAFRKK